MVQRSKAGWVRHSWASHSGRRTRVKKSRLCGLHTQMPMMAPDSVPAKNSINIMAFLLQKNGVPAGARPDDTVDLSKALPSK